MSEIMEYENIYDKMAHISNNVDIRNLCRLVTKKLTVLDPNTSIMWALDGKQIIQISEQVQLDLAKGLMNFMRDHIGNFKNGNEEEDFFCGCLGVLEEFFSSGVFGSDYRKSQELLFNTIKEEINSGNLKRKEKAEEQIQKFFKKSLSNIPDKIIGFQKNRSKESVREQKEWTRAYFIAAMMQEDVINFDLLVKSGEIYNFKFDELDCAFRKTGAFSRDELMQALLLNKYFNSEEEILDYYFNKDKKYFFEMANSKDLAKFLIQGKFSNASDRNTAVRKMPIREFSVFEPDLIEDLLSIEDLPKNSFIKRSSKGNFVSNELMKELNREAFLRVIYSQKIKYKTSLNSNDFIDSYGKLNFGDLQNLNRDKFVNTEDIIKIIKFINVDNSDRIKINLINFYNLDRLEELITKNRINAKFIENFNKFTNEILNDKEREEYFNNLKADLIQKENKDDLAISLMKKGFNFGRIEGYKMSSEYVSDRYLEDDLSDADVLKLHSIGVASDETINEIFGTDGIKEGYREGRMPITALSLIGEDIDYFKQEFEQGRLRIQDIFQLYSMPSGISLSALDTIFGNVDLTEYEIGEMLPDTISPEKVEELFKGYYISHDELSDLVERKIITKSQADKYAKELASHEEYENIFDCYGVALLTTETEGESYSVEPRTLGGGSDPRKNEVKNDPFLQEMLLDRIGFDDRRLQLQGEKNSLNGYIVYPSEKLGVMVFFNPEKVGNATYVMSLQQGMFFLKRFKTRNNTKSEVHSNATKQELRETEHVKVRNACKGWGKNIVDSIKKLSPEMKNLLKEDSEYKKELDNIVQEIREDYDRRK